MLITILCFDSVCQNEIMRTKSGESGDSVSLKNEDHITLKVHGISEAGELGQLSPFFPLLRRFFIHLCTVISFLFFNLIHFFS